MNGYFLKTLSKKLEKKKKNVVLSIYRQSLGIEKSKFLKNGFKRREI